MMADSPEEQAYWIDDFSGTSRCIRFHMIRAPGLPLWEQDAPWLAELAVARGRGWSIFDLSQSQWFDVARRTQLISPEIETNETGQQEGQEYCLNPRIRKAVELHAQRMAEDYFARRKYLVKDVSKTHPYDVLCHREREELHVRLKARRAMVLPSF